MSHARMVLFVRMIAAALLFCRPRIGWFAEQRAVIAEGDHHRSNHHQRSGSRADTFDQTHRNGAYLSVLRASRDYVAPSPARRHLFSRITRYHPGMAYFSDTLLDELP